MNKTNLIGMLLMGAVILVFMHLNQPSAEERAAMAEKARQEQAQAQEKDNEPEARLTDTVVTPAERAIIASTIRDFGTKDSTGVIRLKAPGVNLTLSADSTIGGNVSIAAGTDVPMQAILTSTYGTLSRAQAAQACQTLRKALSDVARYKGFASHMAGDSTTVKLENSRLALEISNKGAVIARAAIKDYQRFDSTQVAPIEPVTDGYNFTLTSASQRFETRNLFFEVKEQTDSTVTLALQLGDGASWGIRYTLHPDSYVVDMDVIQQGMQNVIPLRSAPWNSIGNKPWPATRRDACSRNRTRLSIT